MSVRAKYTPGPWETQIQPHFKDPVKRWKIRPAGEFPGGLWIADGGWEEYEGAEANARLIAASPEMFEALVEAYELMPSTSKAREEWQRKVYSLLKKAEGRL